MVENNFCKPKCKFSIFSASWTGDAHQFITARVAICIDDVSVPTAIWMSLGIDPRAFS